MTTNMYRKRHLLGMLASTCILGCGGPKGIDGDRGDTVIIVTDNSSPNDPPTPGDTGPAGPIGPQGPSGSNGDDGVNGNNGDDGLDSYSVRCHYRRYPYDWSIFYGVKRLADRSIAVALCSGWNTRDINCRNGVLAETVFAPNDPAGEFAAINNGYVRASLQSETLAEFTTDRWTVAASCMGKKLK